MVSLKVKLDSVACADDGVGRQGGAALLLHQGSAFAISDGQVVEGTCETELNIERSELQSQHLSLLNLDHICPIQVAGIVAGVVW